MEEVGRFGVLNTCILLAYLLVMLLIGIALARRQKSTEDFFLAGRRLPWIVVAMSMFASLTSGVSYVGVPGTAYQENISLVVGYAMSPVAAPLLIFLFYRFYHRLRVTTSYEYIFVRFGPAARYATSSLFLLARLGWLGTVIYTPALALHVIVGLPMWMTILLMGGLATAYTALGGLSAAVWTDVIHFASLVIGAVFTAVTLCLTIPHGLSGIFDIASQTGHLEIWNGQFSFYQMSAPIVAVSFFLMIMHDYGVDQVSVQRMLSTNSFGNMAKAAILNSFFDLCFMSLLLFVGIGLFAYYHTHPGELRDGIKPDGIFPFYIMRHLPNGISGLTISAIFVAAMSCMDSAINSLVTVLINDFIRPLRRVARTERQDVALARILTVVLGGVVVCVSFYVSTFRSILDASNTFLGTFGGPILALFLLGILTRRANFRGWLVGTVLAVAVAVYLRWSVGWHWIYTAPISFGVSFFVGYLVSLLPLGAPTSPAGLTVWDIGRSSGREIPAGATHDSIR